MSISSVLQFVVHIVFWAGIICWLTQIPCSFKLVSQYLLQHYLVTLLRKGGQKDQQRTSEAKFCYSSSVVLYRLNRTGMWRLGWLITLLCHSQLKFASPPYCYYQVWDIKCLSGGLYWHSIHVKDHENWSLYSEVQKTHSDIMVNL